MADKQLSHPLEAFEDAEAADDFMKLKPEKPKPPAPPKPSNLHSSSSMPSMPSTSTKSTFSTNQKRMAPRIPEVQSASRLAETPEPTSGDHFSNFLISVDQVRWFYKEEKKSSARSTSPSNATTNGTTNGATAVTYSNPLGATATAGLPSLGVLDSALDPNISLNLGETTTTSSSSTNSNKWQPFNKWDSWSLETEYRDRLTLKGSNEARLVQVLNNLFEVDLIKRRCTPIYWESDSTMTVMRGIWYQDSNDPFEEKYSVEIEKKHLEFFKDAIIKSNENDVTFSVDSDSAQTPEGSTSASASSLTPTKPGKKETTDTQADPIASLTIDSGIVTWYSKDEIYYEKSKSTIFSAAFNFVKRNKIPGSKIKRGFKQKEKESSGKEKDKEKEIKSEEKPGDINHLVFVIHGIAQKLFTNNIVKKCDELRSFCEKAKDDHLGSYKNLRYMFLPVDWRSSLTLDDGIVDSITLKTVSSIRNTLNSSALDIMYYTSPLFRQEIMNSLSSEVNRMYNLFCLKNPNFKEKSNKVSFIAHSLGSVIIYDILTSNNSPTQFSNLYGEDMAKEEKLFTRFSHNNSEMLREYLEHKNKLQEIEKKLVQLNENITPLNFRTDNLFCVGSPLPVFLALRGVRPAGSGKQDHVLPKHLCKRLYNIFHPSDPVAYRIEPLILKHYATKDAIEIVRVTHPTPGKVSYKEANERRKPLDFDLQSNLSKGPVKKEKDSKNAELEVSTSSIYTQISPNKDPLSLTSIDQVELESGFDFKLKNTFKLEKIDHPLTLSIVAWQAHTCYWNSEDTALFIMSQLCTNDSE